MCWVNWKINPPKPGDFIYVRDVDAKEDWKSAGALVRMTTARCFFTK